MKLRTATAALLALAVAHFVVTTAQADGIDDQIEQISAVRPGGKGAVAARAARDALAERGVEILPRLLPAMDTDNLLAANWYRTVFEEIVRREMAKPRPQLPLPLFKDFAQNPKRQGNIRRRMFDVIGRIEPDFGPRIIPLLLDDPEFRGDAIIATLNKGDAARKRGETKRARALYRIAFTHARDSTHVTRAADRLKSVGEAVNIIDHMGFVIDWYLLGPFDAPAKTGFGLSFPPEKRVDLRAEYSGKTGTPIRWKRHRTDDRLGLVNLARGIAPVKEAVGYAYAELNSPRKQTVQLRCGADDNLTVWLNGKKVFSRLQWLNGVRLDRFTAEVTLKEGKNRLLVKVCQGPQHKNPAVPNNWSMQLRLCDTAGAGVGVRSAFAAD